MYAEPGKGAIHGAKDLRHGDVYLRLGLIAEAHVNEHFGGFHAHGATGLQLRHDHGSQFMSDDFQNEIRFLRIESSPAFVREPEGNGCIERFFKTLKEQLLWVRLSLP